MQLCPPPHPTTIVAILWLVIELWYRNFLRIWIAYRTPIALSAASDVTVEIKKEVDHSKLLDHQIYCVEFIVTEGGKEKDRIKTDEILRKNVTTISQDMGTQVSRTSPYNKYSLLMHRIKIKSPAIFFMEWIKRVCGWIYHFSISLTLVVLQRQKSLPDNDGTTKMSATSLPCGLPWSLASTPWATSNGSWCMGIKGEMSGTVCVTFTWYMYIYMSCS